MHSDETPTPCENRDRFVEHLERASETVRSWPIWKQTILGGIQMGGTSIGGVDGSARHVNSAAKDEKGM